MTTLAMAAPIRDHRTSWEPWIAMLAAAALYLRVSSGQLGGLVALVIEFLLAIMMRQRFLARTDEELELLDELLSRDLATADLDRVISSSADRIQGMFATASSTILAIGMAASAFLLLFYASSGATGGIVSVAPKAFVATGFAILCALAFTRDAHHISAVLIEPLRRRKLTEVRVATVEAPVIDAEPVKPAYEELLAQLVSMQVSHLQALNETNQLLSAAASERVDEESGTVRVKLAKGLTEFRKTVELLNTSVRSLNERIDALTREESGLFEHHRRELIAEISRLPQQVLDRAAGMIASSVSQVEERIESTIHHIRDEESRRARDLLSGEFHSLRDQFELTQRSVSTIVGHFNEVVSSLDALASAFDRSAKSVVTSAADFTRDAESLTSSVTDALARLDNVSETKGSLLTPLTEAATAVRKASSFVATDMRRIAAERERLGRVRAKVLELLPKEQGN